MANPYDIPAMNAAACAVGLAGLPFDGPVAAVRLGMIGGQWVVNPTVQELEDATFDIVVAGAKNAQAGGDNPLIAGGAPRSPRAHLRAGGGAVAADADAPARR